MNCIVEKLDETTGKCIECNRVYSNVGAWPYHATCKKNHKKTYTSCSLRGELLRKQLCDSCTGKVRVKIFDCSLHGEVTIGRTKLEYKDCRTCTDVQ